MPRNKPSAEKPIPIFTRDDVEIVLDQTYYIVEDWDILEATAIPNVARDGSKSVYRYGVDRTCPVCMVIQRPGEQPDILHGSFIHSANFFGHKRNAIKRLIADHNANIERLNQRIESAKSKVWGLENDLDKLEADQLNSVQ